MEEHRPQDAGLQHRLGNRWILETTEKASKPAKTLRIRTLGYSTSYHQILGTYLDYSRCSKKNLLN